MKRIFFAVFLMIILQNAVLANKPFINDNGLWGLKDDIGNILIVPEYKKFIILGSSSYIVQKKSKFGLVDSHNNILVPIKYNHAERLLGKYLKIGNGSKYGLYAEDGTELLPIEYSSIDILFGGMFLTCKNYKYGVINSQGQVLIDNICDDIYMPQPYVMRIKYQDKEYEIEQLYCEEFCLPDNIYDIQNNQNYLVSEIISNPVAAVGYSAISVTDYLLKIFSSISPAHEKTIDSLMLYQGVDAVGIYLKLSWIPKYPVTFAKYYFNTIKNPTNGPLSNIKSELKQKLSN